MAVNKNFVVKNGLEVAENLIFADSDKVGIGSTAPLAKLDVKGNINATDVFSSGLPLLPLLLMLELVAQSLLGPLMVL